MGAIARILAKIAKGLASALASSNLLGWGVAVAVGVAYCLLWVGVLTFVFDALTGYLSGLSVSIFGDSSIPSTSVWLLNQTFPVLLFFKLSVGLMIFRIHGVQLIVYALTAARKLK